MSHIPEVYKELIETAATDVSKLLSPGYEPDAKLMQKGLLLYRQGLVTKVRYEDGTVTSTVQDVTPVFVQVELNFFQTSSCSCPTDGICRHIVATFLYAFSQVGSVADWVEEWRTPLHEKKVAEKLGLMKAKDLLKGTGTIKPDYDSWVQTFKNSFQTIMKGQGIPKSYLIPELYQAYNRRLRASAPVEQEWKQLYLLIGNIYSFRQLLYLSQESAHSSYDIERNYQQLFFSLIDETEMVINRLSVHALPFAFDEFIARLKDDVTDLLIDEVALEFERIQLYQLLWNSLFKKKHWREEELEKLTSMGKINGSYALSIGYIHLNLLLKRDEKGLSMINEHDSIISPFLLLWLEDFKSQRDWKRMAPFVDAFIGYLRPYLLSLPNSYACFDFTRYATRVLQSYCSETNRIELYEKILVQLLPYSYREYEQYLYMEKQYEKWSDLQAYIGYDMTSISTDKIKELQKEDPAVLLPLYHQSIQKNIDLKNRGNYRQAVKELKKLRTLYKKLKRQDEFEQFFELLLDRTKRLRAFHEECQRGKLIHA